MRINSEGKMGTMPARAPIPARLLLAVLALVCELFSALTCPAQAPTPQIQQLWQQASEAQRAKDFTGAAALYRKILALDPGLTEAEMNLCLSLHLAGNLQEAVKCFDHATVKLPNQFGPNFLAGTDSLKLNHPDHAIPYLKRAAEEQPENSDVRLALANAELQERRYSDAREQFERATALNAQDPEAWYGLGAAWLSLERDAEAELRKSSSPFRLVLIAESDIRQGKGERAAQILDRVADTAPNVPCVHSMLGFADLQQGKLDEAEKQFQQEWDDAKSEGCLTAQLGKAAVAARRSNADQAMTRLREAAATDAVAVRANRELFWSSLAAAGLEEQARAVLNEEHPANESEHRSDAAAEMRRGRYSACSSSLAAHVASLPFPQVHTLAMCSYYSGHDDRVMTATTRMLRLSPANPEALYWQIQTEDRLANAAIEKASAINPNSPSLHTLMGDMLHERGDLDEAVEEYRRAIELQPDFLGARLHLARILNSQHKLDEAEQQAQWVLKASPDQPEANFILGEVLLNRSQNAQALPFLLRAQQAPPDVLPYVHDDLSLIYDDSGQTAKAIAELKQALSLDIDGSYHYRLGRLYLKIGDRANANAAMSAAKKMKDEVNPAARVEK